MEITRHADVCAILADPGFLVPPAPKTSSTRDIAWVRAGVSRFSNGEAHRQRRALATAELARLDPVALRRDAHERAAALLHERGAREVARRVPVETLAAALGVPDARAEDVAAVAGSYHPHLEVTPDADRAVGRLVDACGDVAEELALARIALLVQACDATAGLIVNSLTFLPEHEPSADAMLARTLREDPPVRVTRRQAVESGAIVTLDLTAGGDADLPFGAGLRPCPGREHALALAAGVLAALQALSSSR